MIKRFIIISCLLLIQMPIESMDRPETSSINFSNLPKEMVEEIITSILESQELHEALNTLKKLSATNQKNKQTIKNYIKNNLHKIILILNKKTKNYLRSLDALEDHHFISKSALKDQMNKFKTANEADYIETLNQYKKDMYDIKYTVWKKFDNEALLEKLKEYCRLGVKYDAQLALNLAAEKGDSELVQLLLMQPNMKLYYVDFAFLYAIQENQFETAQLLSKIKGLNYNFNSFGRSETPLIAAVKNENIPIIEWLLSLPRINVNFSLWGAQTALDIAYESKADPQIKNKIVKKLIAAGAKTNEQLKH